MKITLLCVGRPRGPIREAITSFEARVGHYFNFTIVEVKETSYRGQPVAQLMEEEGERLLARVPPGSEVVALDRSGTQWSSEALSQYLIDAAVQSIPAITFIIGGAYGLSTEVRARADRRLSLSAMTLPHEMARLLLTEQLYRAGTMARGEPYHKGSRR